MLFFGDDTFDDPVLLVEEEIRDIDRLCAKASAVLFVCESARWGMIGAS